MNEIKLLTHQEIDKITWDKNIDQFAPELLYTKSSYLDTVFPEWKALVYDDYKSFIPICERKKGGISYLVQPLFTQQLGVIHQSDSSATTGQFLSYIFQHWRVAELSLNARNFLELLPNANKLLQGNNYLLSLENPYETLYANYSTNCKRNIKKGEKTDLHFVDDPTIDDLITLFRTHRGKTVSAWDDRTYSLLKTLIKQEIKNRQGFLLGAKNSKNELTVGGFFLYTNQRIIFLFSGASDEAREKRGLFLLLNEVIKRNAGKEGLIFDFEGSNDPNLARFYSGFGSENHPYPMVRHNELPYLYKKFIALIKKFR